MRFFALAAAVALGIAAVPLARAALRALGWLALIAFAAWLLFGR